MNENRVRYWKSLDELVQTPEFREAVSREFPDDQWDRLPESTRRGFLKVMGASMAFAGLTACRWPEEEIVPFAHRPEGWVPGVAQQFATAFEHAETALGMVVTSYDGRPVKCEGNPQHPDSLGALPAVAQAAVLGLYDPDRSRRVLERAGDSTFTRSWEEAEAALQAAAGASGAGLAILAESSSSPALARVKEQLEEQLPAARWYEYEPISRDAERQGLTAATGRPLRARPDLAAARVVACFDADPVFDHPAAVRLARQMAEARRPTESMQRIWVAEPGFSLTGAKADHRRAVPHARVSTVLRAVAADLEARHGLELPAGVAGGEVPTEWQQFVSRLADDLAANRGESVVLVGYRQPPAVHALAAALNEALGNVGRTLDYAEVPARPSHGEAIAELAGRIEGGEVAALVILGGNPVYDAPAELDFGSLVKGIPFSAHLSLYDDETSRRCRWHLPRAHALEAWGDGRAWDGTYTLQQPLIAPLYRGRSMLEVAAVMAGDSRPGYELVRASAATVLDDASDDAFRRALHDGLVAGTAAPGVPAAVAAGSWTEVAGELDALGDRRPSDTEPELVLMADPKVYDGRWANNGWLQELPESVTKITWDNAVLMSPTTAAALGIAESELVEVTVDGVSTTLATYLVPGMARGSVAAALGYGRRAAGQVGNGVGVDLYPLRAAGAWSLEGASLRGTGRRTTLATTQDHHTIDMMGFKARNKRVDTLVREATLDAYLADPGIIHHHDEHHPPLISLWEQYDYQGEQWGMSIDLNSCIGCNACVVACQAENNIPVVGREQVVNQREMHWIRVDRYFKTPADVAPAEVDEAEMVFQPMACVQCEMAPCEQVCPVGATQHTEDGLNAMAYNRCIGTRYCSNNCPFKVRRFNFFHYQKNVPQTVKMQHNPEVTVRSRGVMEKCTYCVQRIEKVKIAAKNDRRPIRDGEIVPACAQTCPTRAIVFGDVNDRSTEVSGLRAADRSYATLKELNIKPRTTYMARISNPAYGGAADDAHSGADADRAPGHGHGKETA